MGRAAIAIVFLVLVIPAAAIAQEEEPYSGGEVIEGAIGLGLSVLVEGRTVTLGVLGATEPCTWDLGDGQASQGNPVTHEYAADGTYDVSVLCGSVALNQVLSARELAAPGPSRPAVALIAAAALLGGVLIMWAWTVRRARG